jgi:poly-gamma-glutamate synthesis protein (capsule biosynthesis protein)
MPRQHDPFIRLLLCGDVMTGRGIDQILPHPGDPTLSEAYVRDARDYVRLAERAHGPIPSPVAYEYVWGDALEERRLADPDAFLVNLETSVTSRGQPWPRKEIHYRMNPANVECLTAAGVNYCGLANNHVLDWGYAALLDTLETLGGAGLARAGAGRNAAEAAAPAVIDAPGKGRVLVFSMGSPTSGIPTSWAATDARPGVHLAPDLTEAAAARLAERFRRASRPGDVLVASIHWGGNWGYAIPAEQVRFAHALIDRGVAVVHGHSSHHAKAIEVYRGRLILYGCGDFIDDYEGIGGYERYRPDLRLMIFARVAPPDGPLADVRLVPMQTRRLQLVRAPADDARWLCERLNAEGAAFRTHFRVEADGSLRLTW